MAAVKRYNPEQKTPRLWRGLLLYFIALPLLPAAALALLDGNAAVAVIRGVGFALAMLAATLIRKGMRLEAIAARRSWRRRSSTVPYRFMGACALSLGMLLVAWLGIPGRYSLIDGLLFGAATMIGCYLYYEFDLRKRGSDIASVGITTEELVELLDEAEDRIESIEAASTSIRNKEFRDRLRRIVTEARSIVSTIEKDPVDARRARKFLKVYLDGAQQVTSGYAKMHQGENDPKLEDNFRRVLTTIETVISEQQAKLRENNVSELDVQIEVLQLQLEKEGVV
ncbi:MAG: 5-bromo-4-chloroindolyl phosphate hydrolysis family protein [Gammaproteobacteria bacterium]|nr:5-bromo-4-chloroindolyl phosphate hydrolysis family protein [Gammaproteobacteria bacterium]